MDVDDGDDGDDDDDGDNDVVNLDGFPPQCPQYVDHPEFEWPNRGNGTPIERRQDFERSITFVPLGSNRDPNRPRGRDIDPTIYALIQDNENKRSCRYVFLLFIFSNNLFCSQRAYKFCRSSRRGISNRDPCFHSTKDCFI